MTTEPEFYVYNNWRRNRGRVHRAECPHCNHGTGKAGTRLGLNDEFRGPYTRDAAFAEAAALGRREMKPCAICDP